MNLKFQLLVSISLLLNITNALNSDEIKDDIDYLLNDARRGRRLNDVVAIDATAGCLGRGSFGFVLKGTFNGTIAAFKFLHISQYEEFRREYEIYEYLGSIREPSILVWGVPALHYRGVLKDRRGRKKYDILGISILHQSLSKIHDEIVFGDVDLLLILQKMIKKLKYIHGRRVIHNDIKPGNILMYATELVVIDFNGAKLFTDRSTREVGTNLYGSLSFHEKKLRRTKDDFESLYYTMIALTDKKLPWQDLSGREMARYKRDRTYIRNLAAKCKVHYEVVKVLQDLYDEVTYIEDEYFPYDRQYLKIGRAIAKISGKDQPLYFSWNTDTEIDWAISLGFPHIQDIPGPVPRR